MRIMLVTTAIIAIIAPAAAQSDVEDLYLRRAVKDFVAKNYDGSIEDLEQVLMINKQHSKARKLMAKCYVNKAVQLAASGQTASASQVYAKALDFDPQNQEAAAGLRQINASAVSQPGIEPVQRITERQIAVPPPQPPQQQAMTPQQQVQQPTPATQQFQQQASASQQYQSQAAPSSQLELAVISSALQNGKPDTMQLRVMAKMLDNFKAQQEMMSQQMLSSNKMVMNTQDSKDQYLKMLLSASEAKNETLKQFFIIAGIVILGIVILVFIFLVFVFHRFSKSTELRTIQATDAITALLAAPQGTGAQQAPLLLAGPRAAPGGSVPVDILDTADPIKRAQAVEVVAAEIIEPEKSSRLEKIKKLEELLQDQNNRVRANAAKALYEIDKEASLKTLQGMVASDSKRMIASALWALGEISSEETMQIVLSVDPKDDEIIRYNKKSALEKMKSFNRFPITQDQLKTIEEHIQSCSDVSVAS